MADGPRDLVTLVETDSTNDDCRRRIARGAGHGLAVRAERQTAGRGRRGRRWESPAGNLHLSLVVTIPDRPVAELAFVAGLATAEAVAVLVPANHALRLKWPNDLLLDGRKLGGILIEREGAFAIIGIGVNVAVAPQVAAYPATALAAIGGPPVGLDDLARRIAAAIETWYLRWRDDGFAPVRAAWLGRAAGLGETMEAHLPTTRLCGIFRTLDADGALVIEDATGTMHRVTAADVLSPAP
ncbi:MAG: biotin--[acetyl-CoA-carboxylase] ligase [Alphaproteobacteria bacterium]|nr:biotin--[acetyl-CoA-carboxylase] ligase [Alphaproteobacteria bacterium]